MPDPFYIAWNFFQREWMIQFSTFFYLYLLHSYEYGRVIDVLLIIKIHIVAIMWGYQLCWLRYTLKV